MRAFTLAEAEAARRAAGGPWHELLRVRDLSAGLYVLDAGAEDRQRPHTEDEVYVVLEGRARFTSGGETREVGPGDLLFVPAAEPHRFHDIAQTLRLAVVFAPPEGSRAP